MLYVLFLLLYIYKYRDLERKLFLLLYKFHLKLILSIRYSENLPCSMLSYVRMHEISFIFFAPNIPHRTINVKFQR